MNTKHYATLIDKELTLVTEELKRVGRINPTNPNDWEAVPEKMSADNADENEIASKIEAYEDNSAVLNQLEIQLTELQAAKARIVDGTFGICRVCKAPIEDKRLDANPSSTTCMTHIESK